MELEKKSKVIIKNIYNHKVYYIYNSSPDKFCEIAVYWGCEKCLEMTLWTGGSLSITIMHEFSPHVIPSVPFDSAVITRLEVIEFLVQSFAQSDLDFIHCFESNILHVNCRENYDINIYLLGFNASSIREKYRYEKYLIDHDGLIEGLPSYMALRTLNDAREKGKNILNTHSESLLQILCDHCYILIPGVNRLIRDYVILDVSNNQK